MFKVKFVKNEKWGKFMKKMNLFAAGAVVATAITATTAMASGITLHDVTHDAWYAPVVTELVNSDVISGYSDGTFRPNSNVTNAEFAQLLYNIAGRPSVSGASFSDVKITDWYYNASVFIKPLALKAGFDSSHFKANQPASRQEVAAIMWEMFNNANELNLDSSKFPSLLPKLDTSTAYFKDSSSFASWAKDGIFELNKSAVISGYSDGTFGPTKPVTRAEVASMLDRILHEVGFLKGGVPTSTTISQSDPQPSKGIIGNPTTNSDNIVRNSDGTMSAGNIVPADTKDYSTSVQQDKVNLLSKVKFTTSGYVVTLTFPDTGDSMCHWVIGGSNNQNYQNSKGSTLKFDLSNSNQKFIIVGLSDYNTGYAYSIFLLNYSNGQWVVKYYNL